MSPILLRPVREQLEHDRVIRLLQVRWRRRYQVGMNVGSEQTAPVGQPNAPYFPDLVLWSNERGRRIEGVVEVETAESVNNMEALAQWGPFSRLRAPFYLYIPAGSVDTARRLIADNNITVSEIWTYYLIGDQMRFTMVYRAPATARSAPRRPVAVRPRASAARPSARAARSGQARKPAGRAAAKVARKPRTGQRGGRTVKKASRTTARAKRR